MARPFARAAGTVAAALLAAALGAHAAAGQEAPSGASSITWTAAVPKPADPGERIDAFALERWMDWWFGKNLGDPQIGAPGAVVAVVQGTRVVLAKGYGYADLGARRPARADTVFRVGSVSKPVTATAVMQLVEGGRLDPRRSVNDYLEDFQVPLLFGRPITVLDLVTHTSGLDVRLEGSAAAIDAAIQPLGAYLRHNLPPQVRPSGQVLGYSNQGYALLAHLVEQVSGRAFEAYAAERVFTPLGMARSSYRLTPALERVAAIGYERSRGVFRPSAPVHPHVYPAAGLNTTAEDMARFMVAQLNGGAVDGSRILSESSVEEMHRQQFTMSPAMPGVAFGFYEIATRSERALAHGGGIRGFMSGIWLWPRLRLGLFVANNGYSDALVRRLMRGFTERHIPAPPKGPDGEGRETPDVQTGPLDRFAGAYRLASQPRTGLEKAAALRAEDLQVDVSPYWRRLLVDRIAFRQLGPLQFQERRAGGEVVAFREDSSGRITYLLTTDPFLGNQAWEKLPWYRASGLHRELLVVCALIFISVFALPYRALAHLDRPDDAPAPSGAGRRTARTWLAAVAGLDLAFLGVLVVALRLSEATGLLFGVPPLARLDLALSSLASLLALALPVLAWRAWRRGYWSFLARVHYTACAVAAVAFAASLSYWHLLWY